MFGNRAYFVQVFTLGCLAAVLCTGLGSRIDHESVSHRSAKHGSLAEPSGSRHQSGGRAPGVHPPKHIMKLMQRLSQDQDLLQKRGNTIRSYMPTMRFACNEPTYVFSMRAHKTENLRSLELHFFAPKSSTVIGSRMTTDIHLHLISNTSSACQPIGVQQRPAEARGWQVIDLTTLVSRFMTHATGQEAHEVILGVSFRVQAIEGSHDTPHDISIIEKIVSNHARPFLLMYAQEDESNANSVLSWTESFQRGSPEAAEPVQVRKPIQVESPIEVRSHSRHARSVDNKAHHSIMTNEFPEGTATQAHQATFQHFTEQDSKRRKAKKRTSKRRRGASKRHGKAPLLDQSSSVVEDEQADPPTDDRDQNAVLPSDPSRGACSRHPMFVSFDTIDWDRYVIAPSGFESSYCAGDCSFPLSKTGNPSNHATIQSVMSVAGGQPKIPLPCCVPDKMSSLSILFFDEDGNCELKSYRDMVVESCACR